MQNTGERREFTKSPAMPPCPPSVRRILDRLALAYFALTWLEIASGIALVAAGWLEDQMPRDPNQGSHLPMFPLAVFCAFGLMTMCVQASLAARAALLRRSHRGMLCFGAAIACVIALILFWFGSKIESTLVRAAAIFLSGVGTATLWSLQRPDVAAVFFPESSE